VDEGCVNEVPDELQDSCEPVFRFWFLCLIGAVVTHPLPLRPRDLRAIIPRLDAIWTRTEARCADPVPAVSASPSSTFCTESNCFAEAWDDDLVRPSGTADAGKTGRIVVILGFLVSFGVLGTIFADWLDATKSECDLFRSCSGVITFFPWLTVGLIGGAIFGAVCGMGAINLLRATWRSLRELAKEEMDVPSPIPAEQQPIRGDRANR
jgi:hypothetical protein